MPVFTPDEIDNFPYAPVSIAGRVFAPGSPLALPIQLTAGTYRGAALQYLIDSIPGPVTVEGAGPAHTVIEGGLHFSYSWPTLKRVTILARNESDGHEFIDHASATRRGLLIFENPQQVRTEDVWLDVDASIDLIPLVHIATPAGAPEPGWRARPSGVNRHWGDPYLAYPPRLWRDSLSMHVNMYHRGLGGAYFGNLAVDAAAAWEAANGETSGNFCNHCRFVGGNFQSNVNQFDVRRWLFNEGGDWNDRFKPRFAFELYNHQVEAHGFHIDVQPHLGVWAHTTVNSNGGNGSLYSSEGLRSHVEPIHKNPPTDWESLFDPLPTEGAWIIGGPGIVTPVFGANADGGYVDAGGFRGWLPKYLHGDSWLFEPTAVW